MGIFLKAKGCSRTCLEINFFYNFRKLSKIFNFLVMSAMESEIAANAGSPVKKVEETKPAVTEGGDKAAANGEVKSPQKDDKTDDLKTAMARMAAGKRDLLVQDPNSSVENLAEACELLGKVYGETAKECGEAYFYYGKALLELARMEAGVIDNVLDGVDPEASEDEEDHSFVEGPKLTPEEKDKITDQVGEALEENFNSCEKAKKAAAAEKAKKDGDATDGNCVSGQDKENGDPNVKNESEENSEEDEEEEEEGEEAKEDAETPAEKTDNEEAGPSKKAEENDNGKDNESIGSNEAGTSEIKDSTDKNAIEKEEEEDPSNLQLAWEMLELSKSIFTKHADSLAADSEFRMDVEARLSETYQTLGEVSIENENYPQAIEDLTMCLRRRQDLLPEDSRCIAETHYQLGVALGFNAQFDEAVNALSDAIAVLEKRISFLKEGKASAEPTKAKDAFYTADKEVKEIEGIIPEIKEKIADTKDMQQETIKKIGDRRLVEDMIAQAAAKPAGENGNNLEESTSSQKTTNILAVKKRKTSDEPSTNGDSKKPHLENGTEGGSTSNGH